MVILVMVNVVVVVLVLVVGVAALRYLVGEFRADMARERSFGDRQIELRDQHVSSEVSAMNTELHRVTRLVSGLHAERSRQHGEIVGGLREAVESTRDLAGTTQALREALANSRARGQWGERMADDVLVAAGFVEGINFFRSQRLSTGTVPDFTFPLPPDSAVHMDVKFPIDNYLRFLEAEEADHAGDAEGYLRAFRKDVKGRINELSGRGYLDATDTIDCLLLFIPNEAVYGFIHQHWPELFDQATKNKVVVCSPFTLFAVLAVLRQAAENFNLERTSDEILERLGAFNLQWDKFTDHLDKVDRQLGTVRGTFDELNGVRRRKLEGELDHIDSLRSRRAAVPQPASTNLAGSEASWSETTLSETPLSETTLSETTLSEVSRGEASRSGAGPGWDRPERRESAEGWSSATLAFDDRPSLIPGNADTTAAVVGLEPEREAPLERRAEAGARPWLEDGWPDINSAAASE